MSRFSPAVLLLVLGTACAGAKATGGGETTVAPSTAALVGPGGTIGLTGGNINTTVTSIASGVPLGPDTTFKLLVAVYTKLAIPVAQQSDVHRTIGNDVLRVRRKLAGMNMQDVIDCGNKMGLQNAETWDIQINLLSTVNPDGKGGSQLSTRVEAVGHDPSVSNRDWIPCESKSNLEARIADLVKAAAAAK
jgi:hypothetical protein